MCVCVCVCVCVRARWCMCTRAHYKLRGTRHTARVHMATAADAVVATTRAPYDYYGQKDRVDAMVDAGNTDGTLGGKYIRITCAVSDLVFAEWMGAAYVPSPRTVEALWTLCVCGADGEQYRVPMVLTGDGKPGSYEERAAECRARFAAELAQPGSTSRTGPEDYARVYDLRTLRLECDLFVEARWLHRACELRFYVCSNVGGLIGGIRMTDGTLSERHPVKVWVGRSALGVMSRRVRVPVPHHGTVYISAICEQRMRVLNPVVWEIVRCRIMVQAARALSALPRRNGVTWLCESAPLWVVAHVVHLLC